MSLNKNSLDIVKEWDLYHAYGRFNISFEKIIARIRSAIMSIIYKNYNIVDDLEDGVPESLVDRPLKIILSDTTSSSLIKYLKGLLYESNKKNVLNFTKDEEKILLLLCNKLNDANELRNKIIHSTSSVWNLPENFIGYGEESERTGKS